MEEEWEVSVYISYTSIVYNKCKQMYETESAKTIYWYEEKRNKKKWERILKIRIKGKEKTQEKKIIGKTWRLKKKVKKK